MLVINDRVDKNTMKEEEVSNNGNKPTIDKVENDEFKKMEMFLKHFVKKNNLEKVYRKHEKKTHSPLARKN